MLDRLGFRKAKAKRVWGINQRNIMNYSKRNDSIYRIINLFKQDEKEQSQIKYLISFRNSNIESLLSGELKFHSCYVENKQLSEV